VNDFADAIEFIFTSRESKTGGVEIGGSQLLDLLWEHLLLSGASLALAVLVAVPLGLFIGHTGRGAFLAQFLANAGRAVPSLALIAFFVAYIGVGFTNVMLALVLLAIPPILGNTYVGVRQVDPDVVDAARGMGLTGWQIMRRAELPLAVPTMFGGIRNSAINVVATATIAPLAGVVTLGDPIINASVYGDAGRLGAAIIVAVLAVCSELLFAWLQRRATPRGIRPERRDSKARQSSRKVPVIP
jgi:osmoprotectant transport system permease protein